MNVKLDEWNKLIEYGNKLCNELKTKGYDVRIKSYTVYDGRKGLAMQIFDINGKFFAEYVSGVGTYNTIKENMYRNMKRIITSC